VHHRLPPEPDAEVLPDAVAARLLARASELDAAHGAGAVGADLRAAAAEAGISARAFDAALAELHAAGPAAAPEVHRPRHRRPRWALAAGAAALVAATALAVSRVVPAPIGADVRTGAPIVEQAILLRCLSQSEAAELLRPYLRLPANSIVSAPGGPSRVLVVRATAEQMQQLRSVLDQYERDGSSACVRRPAPAMVP
jgi:hypothetical protein